NTAGYYANNQPYAWSTLTSGDTAVKHMSGLICHAYAGHPASNTGDSSVSGQPRIFAVANIDEREENALGNQLINNIKGCGATVGVHVRYAKDTSTASQQAANFELQERNAHVTTIVCICDAIAALVGAQQNNATGWNPEYIVSDFGFLDSPSAVSSYPAAQWKNAVATAEI